MLHTITLFLAWETKLAIRNILRQRRRTAMALVAVVAGVAALMLAAGFIEWIYWSMRENTIGSRLGHIQIVRSGYFDLGSAEPFSYLLPEDASLRKRIMGLPGVKAVAPRLAVSGLISHGDSTISFVGEGVDPALEAPFDRFVIVASGEGLSPSDEHGIIVGKGLAETIGIKAGDRVVLIRNKRTGGINAVEVTVRGLFSTATKSYDDSALRMPIGLARALLGAAGAHAWVVILNRTEDTDSVVKRIRTMLGPGYDVVPWYRLADFYNKTVALFSRQIAVLKFIIAAIIVLSISNTMIMTVMERRDEIGTSMALGATRRRILRQFVVEGTALGVLGGAIGTFVAALLATAISAVGIPMPAPPGMAHGYIGEIRLTFGLAAQAMGLVAGTALVASVYPALKAARLSIVDALRTNH